MRLLLFLMIAGFFVCPFIVSCLEEGISSPNFVFKPAPREGIVAKVGAEEISHEMMLRGIETGVYRAEKELYDLTFHHLKAMITKKLVEKMAKHKGMNSDEYLEKKVLGNIEVSQKKIDEFIKERKMPKEHVSDPMIKKIRSFLTKQMKEEATDRWLAKQLKKEKVEIYLKKPERPFFELNIAGAPWAGESNARVTIVEFSDFECPYCSKGADILKSIKKKYKKKVKIVFKHFPLPFHRHARIAAHASMCVYEQSREGFWKMHDLMFQQQSSLDKESLKALVVKIGLDVKKFEACTKENKFSAYIDKDIEQGKGVGIRSTPTFFVNGRIINGAQSFEVFEEEIKHHL